MADYKLSFTGAEIDEKLKKIDDLALKEEVPVSTSQLTNDSGFITQGAVPTKTSQLTNDSGFVTIDLDS